ncbi:uncharacterized protein LOC123481960 [Tachysurus ichikawai]
MPPKTTKERSQVYRDKIKADPIKYEERLKRDRERYLRTKVKAIADLSKREQRKQRRQWKINQRNRREEIKKTLTMQAYLSTTTPPHSLDVVLQPEQDVDLTPTPPSAQSQSQNQRGRKRVARNRQKVYAVLYESNIKLEKALRKHRNTASGI